MTENIIEFFSTSEIEPGRLPDAMVVWDHMVDVGGGQIKCRHCGKPMEYDSHFHPEWRTHNRLNYIFSHILSHPQAMNNANIPEWMKKRYLAESGDPTPLAPLVVGDGEDLFPF